MKTFADLEVWKTGIQLLQEVYFLSRSFPKEEQFDLTSQIRRSSKSILANTAEGCGRFTYADRAARFVIARGECAEVEAFVLMAIALGFLREHDAAKALNLARKTGRLLSGLITSAKKHS